MWLLVWAAPSLHGSLFGRLFSRSTWLRGSMLPRPILCADLHYTAGCLCSNCLCGPLAARHPVCAALRCCSLLFEGSLVLAAPFFCGPLLICALICAISVDSHQTHLPCGRRPRPSGRLVGEQQNQRRMPRPRVNVDVWPPRRGAAVWNGVRRL